MTNTFPTVNWITLDGNFIDYRPAIGLDSQTVVFERTCPDSIVKLYILQNLKGENAQLFIPANCQPQTRPDWNWDTDVIALNIQSGKSNTIYTINANGSDLKEVDSTKFFIYPQWASNLPGGGNGFVVMNNTGSAPPKSTLIDSSGKVKIKDMNGTDANGILVFGGMPAVFPVQSTLIAFAGQPELENLGGNEVSDYNEDNNYIFLNAENNGEFTSSPMEPSASIIKFDERFQGRAPAISPDGKFIAFESNRNGEYSIFLFNLSVPGSAAIQLTDPHVAGNAQHPKFFHDGKKLIFSAANPERDQSRIAWIDISAYL